MTRLLHESHTRGAMVLTAKGNCDDTPYDSYAETSHSLLPKCANPQCNARRFDPRVGYCRLCDHEARIHGEAAARAAAGDLECIEVYRHLKTAAYPKPEAKKRVVRKARKARAS